MSKLDLVIVGNAVIHPALVEFLKRSHYYMSYESNTETITFSVNDGGGGKILFEIRNASHENALKLAKVLGLKSSDREPDRACFWSKYSQVLHLLHNGSTDAEWLRIEIFKLGIPCRVQEITGSRPWELRMDQYSYTPPSWSAPKVLEEIERRNKQEVRCLDIGF